MTQQNEVQQASREQLEDTIDTLRTVINMKENRVTQLEADVASITKKANQTIAELTEQIEELKKENDLAELNGVGELVTEKS